MRSVTSILAHVLASAAVVACGGRATSADDLTSGGASGQEPVTPPGEASSSPPAPAPPSTTLPPPSPVPPVPPPTCSKPPQLLGAGESCSDVWFLPCGVPEGVDVSDGLSQAECQKLCGPSEDPNVKYWGCGAYLKDDKPGPSFECYTCVAGRRPAGYDDGVVDASVAGWLAHAADLERVSIDAFQILARELEHHGAPASLVSASLRAEQDEVRHTRSLGALARREHATLATTSVAYAPPRALVDVALENAVEGCVRETYGALVAAWQSTHAARPSVRRAMTRIHRDEARHADLAWRVHAWALALLAPEDRTRVEEALSSAVAELLDAASAYVAPTLVEELGLPCADDARRLVNGLRAELFDAPRVAA